MTQFLAMIENNVSEIVKEVWNEIFYCLWNIYLYVTFCINTGLYILYII